MNWVPLRTALIPLMALIAACVRPAPARIHYGSDACDHCRMTIVDPAFAAQLVTRTGKTYRFDDPGCLVAFVTSGRVGEKDVHSAWLNDHDTPGSIVNARDAFFLASDRIKGPMNGHLAVFGSRSSAEAARQLWGGRIETWDAIVTGERP
jgi:copper chaperone NosL